MFYTKLSTISKGDMSSFVIYVNISSQQKEDIFYFASDLFLLVMVKHIAIFNIFISKYLHCVLYLKK